MLCGARLPVECAAVTLALAIAALLVAIVACVIGVRGWRTSQRLALEMVQLRDRLSRAEKGYRDAAEKAAAYAGQRPEPDEAWMPRMAALEDRLRTALQREVPGGNDEPEPDTRRSIRQHLKREGYERIAILDENADGTVELEAERGGVMTKGRAEILSDGTVRLQAISSVRAFP